MTISTDKNEKVRCFCTEIADTYARKNIDYADSFGKSFAEFGPIAGIVRMSDKFNRIKNLLLDGKCGEVKEESVKDTLLDLAAYSIMLAVEIEKTYK